MFTGTPITAPFKINPPGHLDYSVDDNGYTFHGTATVAGTYTDLPSLVNKINAVITSSEAANNISPSDFKAVLVGNDNTGDLIWTAQPETT